MGSPAPLQRRASTLGSETPARVSSNACITVLLLQQNPPVAGVGRALPTEVDRPSPRRVAVFDRYTFTFPLLPARASRTFPSPLGRYHAPRTLLALRAHSLLAEVVLHVRHDAVAEPPVRDPGGVVRVVPAQPRLRRFFSCKSKPRMNALSRAQRVTGDRARRRRTPGGSSESRESWMERVSAVGGGGRRACGSSSEWWKPTEKHLLHSSRAKTEKVRLAESEGIRAGSWVSPGSGGRRGAPSTAISRRRPARGRTGPRCRRPGL